MYLWMENEGDYQDELKTPIETLASKPRNQNKMESRAQIWNNYFKFESEDNKMKAKCKYCGKELSANSSSNGTVICIII